MPEYDALPVKLAPSPQSSNSRKRQQAEVSAGRRGARTASFGAVAFVLLTGAAVTTSTVATAKSSDTTPTDTNARSTYLKAADKICETSNDRLVEAAKKYETHLVIIRKGTRTNRHMVAKPNQVATFVREVALRELGAEFDQLDRLVPPGSDKDVVASFLNDSRAILAKIEKSPQNAAYTDPFNKLGKKMKQFGFTACGQALKNTNR
jgi:hypothetical protein